MLTRKEDKDPLEQQADDLLAPILKDKKRNKDRSILSDSQLERRRKRETPFSELGVKDKLRFGINIDRDEDR